MPNNRCLNALGNNVCDGDIDPSFNPLVSVGIPTFNRPDGLRRTLELICAQSYQNTEILISDNASPDQRISDVGKEFAMRDCRVKYHRQSENIGAQENFRFVLAESSGEYFMWAADDDEWEPTFIASCISAATDNCSVMTQFSSVLRVKGEVHQHRLPNLNPSDGLLTNVRRYLSNMQPSIIYGLHPRREIQFFLKGQNFDFYDCYFVLRRILDGGIKIVDKYQYRAGVDAEEYQIKYANGGTRLYYLPFFLHSSEAILKCGRLSIREKGSLLVQLIQTVYALRRHHRATQR